MGAVAARPPADGSFDGTSTDGGKIEAERDSGLVAAVSPKAMVSYSMVSFQLNAPARVRVNIPAVMPRPVLK